MSDLPKRINWSDVSAEVRALNPGLFTTGTQSTTPPTYPTKGDLANERELQRLCEQELSRRNIWFIHLSFRAREKVGCPDILCAVNGQAYAFELKGPGGRLSDEQKSTLEHMASNGWKTNVCRSYAEFVSALGGKDAK